MPAGRPSVLTPETAQAFFARYRNSGNVSASVDACGVTTTALYHWLEKGRAQQKGAFRDFLDTFTRVRGELRYLRAARHRRISLGGIEKKPKRRSYFTEMGVEIVTDEIQRDPETKEIVWIETWREPDVRAMEWEMTRDEPELYGRGPENIVNVNNGPTLANGQNPQEVAASLADLFVGAIAVLREHGALPRPARPAIEVKTVSQSRAGK
jgi:hypothetical protein